MAANDRFGLLKYTIMTHRYTASITWTGNRGTGTSAYTAYDRNHTISINGKPDILGSSDPAFRGDPARHNPEDSFVASLSACHMLWYLHLCAVNHVTVESYHDRAEGIMAEHKDGGGEFTEVILHPEVMVRDATMAAKAVTLHDDARKMCFLARSVNFPVHHQPVVKSLHP